MVDTNIEIGSVLQFDSLVVGSTKTDSLAEVNIVNNWLGKSEKSIEIKQEPYNYQSDYIGLVVIFGLILITIARVLAPKRFSAFFKSINPIRSRNFGLSEHDSLSGLPFVLFMIFSIISLSLTLFELNRHYDSFSLDTSSSLVYISLFLAIILIYLLYKIIFVGISIFLYNQRDAAEYYFRDLFNHLLVMSVVLFPLAVLNHFAEIPFLPIIILIISALFFIMNLLDSYIIGRRIIKISHFYIILYLCVLEIAPLIWLYTLV